jgi:hypothetical protein
MGTALVSHRAAQGGLVSQSHAFKWEGDGTTMGRTGEIL